MGPFALDEGLVKGKGDRAEVKIHNTNTGKIIRARFQIDEENAAVDGDFILPGVAGSGSPVSLDFLAPGGAKTGKLLPTGSPSNILQVESVGKIEASMVDAANPCVFVRSEDLGVIGTETPELLEADAGFLERMEAVRRTASVAMGIASDLSQAAKIPSIPKVCVVSETQDQNLLTGEKMSGDQADIIARMISVGQPHRAIPLTGALCLAVATQLIGSIPHGLCRPGRTQVRIGQPSGLTVVEAKMSVVDGNLFADSASVVRTQRRLFSGYVYVPAKLTPSLDQMMFAAE
jgi:2-methylaconitate cis-trans-isomerase PrpF